MTISKPFIIVQPLLSCILKRSARQLVREYANPPILIESAQHQTAVMAWSLLSLPFYNDIADFGLQDLLLDK